MNQYSYYKTENIIGKLLISQFESDHIKDVLELGAGTGSLIEAAIDRWSNLRITASEIDPDRCIELNDKFPQINLLKGDSLELLNNKLAKTCSYDLAICNPPYLKYPINEQYIDLLNSSGFPSCTGLKNIPADILFVAKNMLLLRNKGEMGVIVPDSLITGKQYECFRKDLIKNFSVKKIIQLPERIFSKTEALTHIIIIKKDISVSDSIKVESANDIGKVVNSLLINKSNFISRGDFKYWNWFGKHRQKTNTLEAIGAKISRGTSTHKELKNSLTEYFHTTSFVKNAIETIASYDDDLEGYRCAKSGDILIARVGKRCIGNVAMITSGYIPISDCIYKISVPKKYRKKVLKAMTSKMGQKWFTAHAHGVCSQVISLSDLMKFDFN